MAGGGIPQGTFTKGSGDGFSCYSSGCCWQVVGESWDAVGPPPGQRTAQFSVPESGGQARFPARVLGTVWLTCSFALLLP